MKDTRRIIADLVVAVITADGKVTRSEMETVARLRGLGLGDLTPFVSESLERAAREPLDPEKSADELGAPGGDAGAIIVSAMAEVAAADGILAGAEVDVIRVVARRLGLTDTDCDRVIQATIAGHGARATRDLSEHAKPRAQATASGAAPQPSRPAAPPSPQPAATTPRHSTASEHAAHVLGVSAGCSRQDLQAAYRRAVELYDPLRVVDLGPEFAVLAVRRLQVATDAFEALLASTRPA